MSKLIPDGWKITPLNEKVNFLSGFPFKSALFVEDKTKIGLIRIRDIQRQELRTHYSGEYDDTYIVKKGDVLIGMDGDFNITKWRIKDALLNQRICKVTAIDESGFDTDFLYYFLAPELLLINEKTVATTVKHLSVKDLREITKPFPPLPEQQKIAKILTSVDEVIEKTQAQIDKLKDLKTGMMQELLTNGIDHTEFKDSPVGRIPAEWEVKPLIEVVKNIIDCEHKTAPYVEKSEYLVVRTSNVRNGELTYQDIKFTSKEGFEAWTKRAVPSVGDVLFTREAPAGESCLVPVGFNLCMGQRMVLLRPKTEIMNHNYFSTYLNSEFASKEIYELSIGTTVTRINIDDIKKIKCIVPPLAEQTKIAASIGSVKKAILSKQNKLSSLADIKKALMQDLLTGKVRVKVDSE